MLRGGGGGGGGGAQALGLVQYEAVFRRREVDGCRMMEVDDGELAALGVEHRVHRATILRMRDGKIVEHWGGPHCQDGLGYIR